MALSAAIVVSAVVGRSAAAPSVALMAPASRAVAVASRVPAAMGSGVMVPAVRVPMGPVVLALMACAARGRMVFAVLAPMAPAVPVLMAPASAAAVRSGAVVPQPVRARVVPSVPVVPRGDRPSSPAPVALRSVASSAAPSGIATAIGSVPPCSSRLPAVSPNASTPALRTI